MFVSRMQLNLQEHFPSEIVQDRCATVPLSGNKDLMLLVDHKSIILPPVKLSVLSINQSTS